MGELSPELQNSLKLIVHLTTHNKFKMLLSIVLLIISGLLEGFSVIALFPVIALISKDVMPVAESSLPFMKTISSLGIAQSLPWMLSIIVIGIFLKSILLFLASRVVNYAAVEYGAEKRQELIRSLMSSRWQYFVHQPAGLISSALTTQSDQIIALYTAIILFYASIIQTLVYAGMAALVSWKILVLSAFVGCISILILKGIMLRAREAGKIQVDTMDLLSQKMLDSLQILKPLKAMAKDHLITPFLHSYIDQLKSSRQKLSILSDMVKLSQEPIITFFLAIGLYIVFTQPDFNVSAILFMALIYYRLVTRVGVVQSTLQKVTSQQDSFWVVDKIICETRKNPEQLAPTGQKIRLEKAITLADIGFSYADTPMLSGINLTIPARSFVGIVGPSGAGKSTLIDLLIGFNIPQTGAVFVDGIPLSEIDMRFWRQHIGFVPQDLVLANDTIFNNIALYDPNCTPADVMEALQKAEAADFVNALPKGLGTLAGERGARLSGGQRQRLSIARALVHHPDILILDEPTTALDPKTEEELCKTLKMLSQTMTVIAISHQQKIAEISDTVYRMESGKIASVQQR